MSSRVLILTEFGDSHAYAVCEALGRQGADFTLWHTTDFPTRATETIHFEGGRGEVSVREPGLNLDDLDVGVVWNRRPSYTLFEEKLHPADRRFADSECSHFRRTLISLLAPEAFWVNPPDAAIRAERKPFQHQIAFEVGFTTPATLYTNDPQEIRALLKRKGGRIIYKPFRGIVWNDGETRWTPYTSLITEANLVEDDLLRAVPGIYQEVVPKDYELRITVMGERVFGAKIRSQETVSGRLDWRRSYDELQIEPCGVPKEVAERCRQMLRRLGLVFGCFDLIVTPAGEYVFLEVNQAGQFLFVERYAGIPLLDAFVKFLLQARTDFDWDEASVTHRYVDLIDTLPQMEADLARLHVVAPDHSIHEAPVRARRRKRLRHDG